jgi:RHS repeat-associated protein
VKDSYFIYDDQDRLMCETTNLVSSCPTSGTNIKVSRGSPAFTAAGDWRELIRPVPGSTGLVNSFNPSGYGTSHQITLVRQNDGTPQLGDTVLQYNTRGNRASDDNTSTLSHDARTYTYDDRNNLINVHGEYLTGGNWHEYDVASAFDARGRRILKVFTDTTTSAQAQWLFDYDGADRLTEVKYTPDLASPSTYDMFQLVWLGDRLVAYWQTTYPAATTSRRYVTSDETGRPFEMWNWPTGTGNATRVWALNPTAWGGDVPVLGTSILQPLLFAGHYIDVESVALNDAGTQSRPPTALNGFRTYDPFTGAYLQVDPKVDKSWNSYDYVSSDPVGKSDPDGRLSIDVEVIGATPCALGSSIEEPEHLSDFSLGNEMDCLANPTYTDGSFFPGDGPWIPYTEPAGCAPCVSDWRSCHTSAGACNRPSIYPTRANCAAVQADKALCSQCNYYNYDWIDMWYCRKGNQPEYATYKPCRDAAWDKFVAATAECGRPPQCDSTLCSQFTSVKQFDMLLLE